jgi:hypothetical protein
LHRQFDSPPGKPTASREWRLSGKQFNTMTGKYWPISDRLAAPERSFGSKLPNLTVPDSRATANA